jgi:hypothetical protein
VFEKPNRSSFTFTFTPSPTHQGALSHWGLRRPGPPGSTTPHPASTPERGTGCVGLAVRGVAGISFEHLMCTGVQVCKHAVHMTDVVLSSTRLGLVRVKAHQPTLSIHSELWFPQAVRAVGFRDDGQEPGSAVVCGGMHSQAVCLIGTGAPPRETQEAHTHTVLSHTLTHTHIHTINHPGNPISCGQRASRRP